MKILQFDSVGGASGDMILGALIDLGVNPDELNKTLKTSIHESFEIEALPFSSHHLSGIQASVRITGHHHDHRTFREIAQMIGQFKLPVEVRDMAVKVFRALAEAEAQVHRTTPEEVHFHEVGAVDSIVDIVGSCLALHTLGVSGVAVGPLPMGRGTVKCAHGIYPCPAPAVVELLKNFPVVQIEEPFETVTPTGAALLSIWKSAKAPPAGSRMIKAGHGFGHHAFKDRPNLLRAVLFECEEQSVEADECIVLESNMDDTTPELLGTLSRKLMEAGALDVFATAIQMKKQRPGTLLTVLCQPEIKPVMLDLIFRESTTFGVREHVVQRTTLERRFIEVATAFGPIRIKIGSWRGQEVTFAPEMDDCVARATEKQVPVRRVYEEANRVAQSLREPGKT